MIKIICIFAVLINNTYSIANENIILKIAGAERKYSPMGVIYKHLSNPAIQNYMEHYKNLSLENLPNEIWKDVVGYEGIYKISSYGRLKALNRKYEHNINGKVRILKVNEKIRKNGLYSKNIFIQKKGSENPQSKKVIQYDLNNNKIKEWAGIREIQRELGFSRANISSCCNNRPNCITAYGYKWSFL